MRSISQGILHQAYASTASARHQKILKPF